MAIEDMVFIQRLFKFQVLDFSSVLKSETNIVLPLFVLDFKNRFYKDVLCKLLFLISWDYVCCEIC